MAPLFVAPRGLWVSLLGASSSFVAGTTSTCLAPPSFPDAPYFTFKLFQHLYNQSGSGSDPGEFPTRGLKFCVCQHSLSVRSLTMWTVGLWPRPIPNETGPSYVTLCEVVSPLFFPGTFELGVQGVMPLPYGVPTSSMVVNHPPEDQKTPRRTQDASKRAKDALRGVLKFRRKSKKNNSTKHAISMIYVE